MKLTIEVEVPEGVDLDHAYQSVTDALYLPHNVTQAEFNLVASVLNQLAKEKSTSVPKNGFREWAETHHEIVATIHAIIDNGIKLPRLERLLKMEGFGGLYDLCIELTNEFCKMYENEEWDGDWVDTIHFFVDNRLA